MFIYLPRLFLLILLGVIYFLFLPLASVAQAAWQEVASQRTQHSRTYQDTQNPNKKSWDGTLAPLHYESTLGSGNYNTSVDMTPVRVNNAQLDGWKVTQAGWHYALGKPGDKTTDGWVGFGGRKGQNWFKFRLARAGYLHWPTRAWQDIGGAPTYNRANLSSQINSLTLGPNNDQIPVETVATWSNLWTTPGGGSLSVSWRANGERLKEEITLNQAGRNWIAANRPPTTPLSETYFGFTFQLDWSDIPKVIRAGIEQNIESDFADDSQNIELKDSLDRLLAFMPLDNVKVPNANPLLEETQPLRKRFWKDGDGNYYLLVGIRTDTLNSMASGDLVFDPTIDAQVGASSDDAYWTSDGAFSLTDAQAGPISRGAWGYAKWGTRFTGITIPDGATITVAYLTYTVDIYGPYNATVANATFYGFDTANPATFSTKADYDGRARTTTSVAWNNIAAWPTVDEEKNSASLVSIIEELMASYSYASGAAMAFEADGSPTTDSPVQRQGYSYNGDTTKAPKLHIEYTTNQNPTAPSSLGPTSLTDGSWGSDNTPTPTFTLSDPDAADTVKFRIQIDDSSDFLSAVVDYTSALAAQGATSFTVGQAAGSGTYTTGTAGQTLSDGSYYWRVLAIDNSAAESAYSTANAGAIAFKVDTTAPSAVSALTSSSHTASTWSTDTTIDVSWTAATDTGGSGVAGYSYLFDTSATTTPDTTSDGATTSTTSGAQSDGNSIYFHVRAIDNAGNAGSAVHLGPFYVDTTAPTVPGTPSTTTPTSDNTPTWSFTASTDGGSGLHATTPYSVQWCTDSAFTGCATNTATSTTNSFTHSTVLADGTWYFRVKGTDAVSNSSSYSSNGSVVVDTTAPSTPGTSSTTSPTTDTTPTWTWTASSDSGSGLATTPYTLQWSSDSSFATGVNSSTATTNSFTHSTALADGTWYFRVKATDAASNESSYSGNGSVVVDTTAPSTPGTPSTTTPTTDTTPTWTWTASSDSGSGLASTPYTLQWCTDSSFSGCSANTSTADTNSFTHSTALTDGTWYFRVKAKDSLSNETSYSSSGSVVVDTTAPTSFDLDSPGGDSYTNNERPTFRWKAASTPDATSGLSKYKLEIDNGDSGDFTIDDIPTSRTTDYEANKYYLKYENFSDSDNTNNYISVYTKSSSSWGTDQNDGKLKEGKRRWKVVAIDQAGNTREESRGLFVDKTGPSVEVDKKDYTTNDTTPTISGKITDSLSGDKTDNKVASGPKEVEIKFEKKSNLGIYNLHSLTTISLETTYWTSDDSKITDNSKNTSNKYTTFSFTPTESLPLGIYKITVSGKDKAGNTGTVSFSLTIGILAEVVTPEEEKIIEEVIREEVPGVTPETKEKIKEELGLTKPTPPEELRLIEEVIPTLINTTQTIYWGIIKTTKAVGNIITGGVEQVAALWQAYANFVQETNKKPSAVLGLEKKREALPPITLPPQMLTQETLPGVVHETLLATTQFINSGGSETMTIAKQNDSKIGQKKLIIPTEELQLKIVSLYTILFDKEPTRITEVKIAEVGKDYAVIIWKTNHYTINNKINYGKDLSYTSSAFAPDKKKEHTLKIINLKPGTKYLFEVMSQNKNYVYDANREFTTLGE